MTLKECYDAFGGNYESVVGRLRKESMVQKFVLMFLKDDNLEALDKALPAGDYETAHRAAHSIKGNSLNLDFGKLGESSKELSDLLKPYDPKSPDHKTTPPSDEDIQKMKELLEDMRADYTKTRAAIQAFKDSLEG